MYPTTRDHGWAELIYKYVVSGSDKASIDTGVDVAQGGSGDWAGGDVLEIMAIARTDDAAAIATVGFQVNGDTGANYDRTAIQAVNATPSGGTSLAQTTWLVNCHGSGGGASYATLYVGSIPFYTATTFFKVLELRELTADSTAGSNIAGLRENTWRSTAAITRLAMSAQGAAKLKVGSTLLVYKRIL